MMKLNFNEDQRNKENSTLPKIKPPSMMDKCEKLQMQKREKKTIYTEDEDMIHRHMNKNEAEINLNTLEEVID